MTESKKTLLTLASGLFLVAPNQSLAQDSISFTIGGFMPARCEVEMVAVNQTSDQLLIVADRYCNIPHTFEVDYEMPDGVDETQVAVTVNQQSPSASLSEFTDDRAVIRVMTENLDEDEESALFASINVRFVA
jgi:hypothetical protein